MGIYKSEDRGKVRRYYNVEKRELAEKERGASYMEYRKQWDDKKQVEENYENPLEIMLELTSWCNYKCEMCFRSYTAQNEKINMPLEMVKDIVDQSREMNIKSFWLGAGSECLIHPQIVDILKEMGKIHTEDFTLLTNGSRLTKEISKVLVDIRASQLSISLDAATNKTYRKIRKANLENVEQNIKDFLEIRGDRLFPLLRVSMVEVEDNLDEREMFFDKWKDVADIIDYQRLMDFSKMDDFDNIDEFYTECLEPFRRMIVYYDGDISPCSTYYGHYHVVGNINKMSLRSAWNCEKTQHLRESIRNKNFCAVCKKCKIKDTILS